MKSTHQRLLSMLILFLFVLTGLYTGCTKVKPIEASSEQHSLNGIPFTMIHIPAMEFPADSKGIVSYMEDSPDVLKVEDNFWLAETNSSYELWSEVYRWALENGYTFNMQGRMGSEESGEGMNNRHPVTNVDWLSVMVWCNALTEHYNKSNGKALKPVYEYNGVVVRDASDREIGDDIKATEGADGFRLPTGTEWELVARYSIKNPEGKNQEYPGGSGIYWRPFKEVNGEVKESEDGRKFLKGKVVTREITDVEKNQLGFYGLTGEKGNLWQWCFDLLPVDPRSKDYRLKRGGSWDPHCGRFDHWPKKEACHGFCQITFRVARTAVVEQNN